MDTLHQEFNKIKTSENIREILTKIQTKLNEIEEIYIRNKSIRDSAQPIEYFGNFESEPEFVLFFTQYNDKKLEREINIMEANEFIGQSINIHLLVDIFTLLKKYIYITKFLLDYNGLWLLLNKYMTFDDDMSISGKICPINYMMTNNDEFINQCHINTLGQGGEPPFIRKLYSENDENTKKLDIINEKIFRMLEIIDNKMPTIKKNVSKQKIYIITGAYLPIEHMDDDNIDSQDISLYFNPLSIEDKHYNVYFDIEEIINHLEEKQIIEKKCKYDMNYYSNWEAYLISPGPINDPMLERLIISIYDKNPKMMIKMAEERNKLRLEDLLSKINNQYIFNSKNKIRLHKMYEKSIINNKDINTMEIDRKIKEMLLFFNSKMGVDDISEFNMTVEKVINTIKTYNIVKMNYFIFLYNIISKDTISKNYKTNNHYLKKIKKYYENIMSLMSETTNYTAKFHSKYDDFMKKYSRFITYGNLIETYAKKYHKNPLLLEYESIINDTKVDLNEIKTYMDMPRFVSSDNDNDKKEFYKKNYLEYMEPNILTKICRLDYPDDGNIKKDFYKKFYLEHMEPIKFLIKNLFPIDQFGSNKNVLDKIVDISTRYDIIIINKMNSTCYRSFYYLVHKSKQTKNSSIKYKTISYLTDINIKREKYGTINESDNKYMEKLKNEQSFSCFNNNIAYL